MTRHTAHIFVAAMNGSTTRTDVDLFRPRDHVVLLRLVGRNIVRHELTEVLNTDVESLADECLQMLLVLQPLLESVHLVVPALHLERIVHVVVMAIAFGVERRERFWTEHESEQAFEKTGICVQEVGTVSLSLPDSTWRQHSAKETRAFSQGVEFSLEFAAADVEGDDFGVGGEDWGAAVITSSAARDQLGNFGVGGETAAGFVEVKQAIHDWCCVSSSYC